MKRTMTQRLHGFLALMRCQLCWAITFAVFVAILIIETVIAVPSYNKHKQELIHSREEQALVATRVLLQSRHQEPSDTELESLLDHSLIRGIRFNSVPPRQLGASVGAGPEPSDQRLEQSTAQGSTWINVRWPGWLLGQPVPIDARIDTTGVNITSRHYALRILALSLLVAVFITVVTMAMLGRMFLSPLLKFSSKITAAGDDPAHPIRYLIGMERRDELGQVFHAFNRLLRQSAANLNHLQSFNRRLEAAVKERTMALSLTNQHLKVEKAQREQANDLAMELMRFPDENRNPVFRLSANGELLYANKASTKLLKNSHKPALSQSLRQVAETALSTGALEEIEDTLNQRTYLFQLTPVPERGYVNVYGIDITDRKRYELELRQRSWYDALTGLPNRALLTERLTQTLAEEGKAKKEGAILIFGLHEFHNINGSMGHPFGDFVLKVIARRLLEQQPHGATAARLGGDHFALLWPHIGKAKTDSVVRLAGSIISALKEPIVNQDEEVQCNVYTGIALIPADGADSNTLLKHAELAMYRAKSEENSKIAFFEQKLGIEVQERQRRFNDLRRAIDQHQFKLHYQPQVDGRGSLIGVEALLRWIHPVEGMIPPGNFIPLAENTGLIHEMGNWVFDEACRQATQWYRSGARVRMAINLFAGQLQDGQLANRVRQVLRENKLPPELLELEITESAMMHDVAETQQVLEELGDLGVSLAIDDFGTGYSSLAYLKRFPIHRVKIDKAFVQGLPANERDAALCDAILRMTEGLHLSVIAEGVESAEQAEWLTRHGCSEFQGFLFGRPVPAEELEPVLAPLTRPSESQQRS